MFYYIEGTVALLAQNLAVIDAGGVGYACMTTAHTLSRLETGGKARLYTYCNVKEDAFDIYGFFEPGEKRCFEMLLSVSGVGPKAALSVLSSSTPQSLAVAIVNDDTTALTMAPGIGKKIAQRIILELKDKVSRENSALKGASSGFMPPKAGQAADNGRDAAAALSVLGYSQSEISAALRAIDTQTTSVEDIIKQVLANSL